MLGGDNSNSSNLLAADWESMNCDEITSKFATYKSTVETSQNFNSLIGLVSAEAATTSRETAKVAMDTYDQAKAVAEPVMAAKGCDYSSL